MYTISFDFAGSLHYTCDRQLSEAVSGAVHGAIADAFTNLTGYSYPDKFDAYDFMLALVERGNKTAWEALLDRACWEGLNVLAVDENGVAYKNLSQWQKSGATCIQSVKWLDDIGSLLLSIYYRTETGEFRVRYRDARRGIDIWSTDVRGLVAQLERWALAHALDQVAGSSSSREMEL